MVRNSPRGYWPALLIPMLIAGIAMTGFSMVVPLIGVLGMVLMLLASGLLTAHVQMPGGLHWPGYCPPVSTCADCGYSLRGLARGSRCPECGGTPASDTGPGQV